MNCREFERDLEAATDDVNRPLIEDHAAQCESCAELLVLARLPVAAPAEADLVSGVLARTAGACGRVEERLNEFVAGLSAPGMDADLLAEHLRHCDDCRNLASELERLTADLPRLAVIRPHASLVDDVLRRTLPAPVRLRRLWARTWPRWVRRPRFAVELAYAATLVLVVIFATPVSPLQAMPERALGLVRSERPLGADLLPELPRRPASLWPEVKVGIEGAYATARSRAQDLAETTRVGWGTLSAEVASWFETADDDAAATNTEEQETP